MDQQMLTVLARQVERHIAKTVADTDVQALAARPRRLVTSLKREAAEIRLDMRDYEYAQTRHEQLSHARAAHERLQALRESIVATSEYGLFTPADVVQLSAWIDTLLDQLV